MADEINVVETWLHSVLNDPDDDVFPTAVPGGFWPGVIPQENESGAEVAFPAGVYQLTSATDLVFHNVIRLWSNQLWTIRVTAAARASGTLSAAVSRLDAVLHGQVEVPVGDDGARVFNCVREQSIDYSEHEPGGTQWRHRGGIFRIRAADA